jgi:hypothetical protein
MRVELSRSEAKFFLRDWGIMFDYGIGLSTIVYIPQSGTKNLVSLLASIKKLRDE